MKDIQNDFTKSRIIEFGLDFVEKSKIEVERNFWTKIAILTKIN